MSVNVCGPTPPMTSSCGITPEEMQTSACLPKVDTSTTKAASADPVPTASPKISAASNRNHAKVLASLVQNNRGDTKRPSAPHSARVGSPSTGKTKAEDPAVKEMRGYITKFGNDDPSFIKTQYSLAHPDNKSLPASGGDRGKALDALFQKALGTKTETTTTSAPTSARVGSLSAQAKGSSDIAAGWAKSFPKPEDRDFAVGQIMQDSHVARPEAEKLYDAARSQLPADAKQPSTSEIYRESGRLISQGLIRG